MGSSIKDVRRRRGGVDVDKRRQGGGFDCMHICSRVDNKDYNKDFVNSRRQYAVWSVIANAKKE